jgi:hypothetical protein
VKASGATEGSRFLVRFLAADQGATAKSHTVLGDTQTTVIREISAIRKLRFMSVALCGVLPKRFY